MPDDVALAARWRPLVDAVGRDFAPDAPAFGDPIELGAVARFLAPLTWDCVLHRDDATARRHGYAGVVVPVSAYLPFVAPEVWEPGDGDVFAGGDAHAEPRGLGARRNSLTGLEPPFAATIATDLGIDVRGPVIVGDRLCRATRVLVSCAPRCTRLGAGAFVTWRSELHAWPERVVAVVTHGLFLYDPTDESHTGSRL